MRVGGPKRRAQGMMVQITPKMSLKAYVVGT